MKRGTPMEDNDNITKRHRVSTTKTASQLILIGFGYFFFFLGVLGSLLPVVPTTPFLIVAYFCFSKGSPRFHQWFLSTPLYKKYLEELINTRTMPLHRKLVVSIPITISFTVTSILLQNPYYTFFCISAVIIMVLFLFIYIK